MGLADQIEQAKKRDQIKAWDKGERALAATIATPEVELRRATFPVGSFLRIRKVKVGPAPARSAGCGRGLDSFPGELGCSY